MRRAACFLLTLFLLISCTRGVGTGSDDRIEHPTGEEDLVVRLDVSGGLLPPEERLQAMPSVSIFGDGSLFVSGPQIEIYPPPAMVNPLKGKLEEKDIQAILLKAEDAGMLQSDRRIENNRVADAPTYLFLINARGESFRTEAYALFEAETEEANQIRAFQEFVSKYSDKATEQWSPDRIQLVVFEPGAEGIPEVEPNRVEWPLSTGPQEFGSTYEIAGIQMARCGVVKGDELKMIRDSLEQATTITRWTSKGKEFRVAVAPLLPDQAGCPDQSA